MRRASGISGWRRSFTRISLRRSGVIRIWSSTASFARCWRTADAAGSAERIVGARMPDIAQQSSERERVAVDAERDTEKLKKAEFMLDKIGEEFDGIISGVTSFGMFIELDNTVEGLIRLSDLTDDYYHFHELHMALIGERTSQDVPHRRRGSGSRRAREHGRPYDRLRIG